MKNTLKKSVRLHNRTLKNVKPNRNENGFMTFIADYVRYSDFNTEL